MKNLLILCLSCLFCPIVFGQINERHKIQLRDTTIDDRPFVKGVFSDWTFLIHKKEFKAYEKSPAFSFKVLHQNPISALDSFNNTLRYKLSDTIRRANKQLLVEKIDKKMRFLMLQTLPNTEGVKWGYRLGETIEDMNFMTIDNQVFRSRTEAGQFILYDFWATWCVPCLAAMPKIKAFSQTPSAKNVKIVSIAQEFGVHSTLDSNVMRVQQKITELEMNWTNVYELFFTGIEKNKRSATPKLNNNMVSEKLNVQNLPTYILTDDKGLILCRSSHFEDVKKYMDGLTH
jgi:thiol-disulfide isomerase/thioredoxin